MINDASFFGKIWKNLSKTFHNGPKKTVVVLKLAPIISFKPKEFHVQICHHCQDPCVQIFLE